MRRPASVLAPLLLVFTFGINALGLGDIELLSALNEPLDAQISLRAVKEGDLESLQIRIATKDHFQRAGINRAFVLTTLKFTAEEGSTPGTGRIRISTQEPITEPFLNFLLDVDWPQGRVIREYTVLLDPPIYGAAISTAVEEAVTTVESLPELAETVVEPEITSSGSDTSSSASSSSTSLPKPGTYGPVKSSDTLWSLAERLRPDNSVTVQQTMLALLNVNPNAFARGNINALQQGKVLRVPDAGEINAVSASEALDEVKRQHALWEQYRQSANASVGQQPAGAVDSSQMSSDSQSTSSASDSSSSNADDSSRLDIVSGGAAEIGAGGSSTDVAALQDELSVALEEADIQQRENDEMRARLAEADAIISQLQRAVDIKDDDIAALQNELARTQAELEAKQEPAVVESTPEPVPEPEPAPTPEPEPVPEPQPITFMDVVASFIPLDNPLILGGIGGGLLLLIILVVVFAKRRRKTDDDFDAPSEVIVSADDDARTEIPFDEDATQLPPMDEAQSQPDPFDSDEDATQLPPSLDSESIQAEDTGEIEEDDPLEGLNIYLAYEDYDNATKLVKDVIAKHPDRHECKLRLLEIYYASKNATAFESAAGELQGIVGEDSPMMDSARHWWDDLSPSRGLFEEAVQDDGAFNETHVGVGSDESIFDVTDAGTSAFGEDDTMEISLDDVEAGGDGGGVDFDLGFEFDTDEAHATEISATAQDGDTLDFEIGAGDEQDAPSELDDGEVDFDLDMEAEPTELPVEDSALDGDTVEFELDVTGADDASVAEPEVGLDIELPAESLEGSPEGKTGDDLLDFALDFDDSGESDPTELPTESAPEDVGEDGIDFDLDFETLEAPDSGDDLDSELALDDAENDADITELPDLQEAEFNLEIPGSADADDSSGVDDDGLDFSLDSEDSLLPSDLTEAPVDNEVGFSLDLDSEEESETQSSPTDTEQEDTLDLASYAADQDGAGEIKSLAADDSDALDFSLDDDPAESPPDAPVSEDTDGGLDFALDLGESDGDGDGASLGTEDSLDFALDMDDSVADESATIPTDAALESSLDFDDSDLAGSEIQGGDVDESELDFALDLDDSAEIPATLDEISDIDANGDKALDFALDFESDLDEADANDNNAEDAESTQYMLRDVPEAPAAELDMPDDDILPTDAVSDGGGGTVFMIEQPAGDAEDEDAIDLSFGIDDDGESTETSLDSTDGELDFALDVDDKIGTSADLENTSFIMDHAASAQSLEEALDISLDLDESGGGASDFDLDFDTEPDGDTTVRADDSGSTDAPTLDFDLDDPLGVEPAPDFETVQLKADDLERVGAIGPEVTGTLEDDAIGVEVASDFADIFGGDENETDDLHELDIELPDSALMAEEADVANVDELDFDFGIDDDPEPGASDYERTQYMLRDIANITSDDDDDEDDKTLVLGRSGGGEVDEMQTKLDLAQAYIDMGDTEGARNILGEVMAEGSDAQQDLARHLLSELN